MGMWPERDTENVPLQEYTLLDDKVSAPNGKIRDSVFSHYALAPTSTKANALMIVCRNSLSEERCLWRR